MQGGLRFMWNYKNNYKDGWVTYDGNLEEDLIKAGVPKIKIEEAKKTIVLYKNEIPYYDSWEPEREIRLVPVNKIVGFSRSTVGMSIYDNVSYMGLGDREPTRFNSALMYLTELGYEGLCKSYRELEDNLPRIDYYENDDIYIVDGDGNHRSLVAKLIGASYIRAKVVTKHCNYDLKDKYETEKKFRKKHKITEIKKCIYGRTFYGDYSFYFNRDGELYRANCFDDCISDNFYESIVALDQKMSQHENLQDFFESKPKFFKEAYKFLAGSKEFDNYIKVNEYDNMLWTNGVPCYLYKDIKD